MCTFICQSLHIKKKKINSGWQYAVMNVMLLITEVKKCNTSVAQMDLKWYSYRDVIILGFLIVSFSRWFWSFFCLYVWLRRRGNILFFWYNLRFIKTQDITILSSSLDSKGVYTKFHKTISRQLIPSFQTD